MIGNSGKTEAFSDEIIEQLFVQPITIAISSMQLEVNGRFGSNTKTNGGQVHIAIPS